MGDVPEAEITPETPGRPAVLNPFESPNDYHRLHESVVASPSVFKSSRASSATPAKFKWSIDEMASLHPVEIDPEDIHPSCQTVLSLPVDFDLEKVLGEYYKLDEISDQVQESLSSSSLRRKLFLDGIGSGSESSAPSSPDRSPEEVGPKSSEVLSSVSVSPLQCGMAALTPTSGQFSSSPIQSRGRTYSLGSVTSPVFLEKTSPNFKSPTLSPIVLQCVDTPVSGERKKLNFVTPDGINFGSSSTNNICTESPYVEGCSPIKSCSPFRPLDRGWVPPCYRASPLESPTFAPASEDQGSQHTASSVTPVDMETCLLPSESLSGKIETAVHNTARLCNNETALPDLVPMEETRDSGTVNMAEPVEGREDYCAWAKEMVDSTPIQLTSSRTGSMSNMESTNMFVSLLAEGSTMPCDNSMQMLNLHH
ncbi:hypothetical protein JZ751_028007 [Albula glossodonta]|uniref:Protein aurora borealis n=1 Tax=Albula glossodonta TaxID=121402 RepID=A0A8T2PC29_9TELE|nr:hypothetical protein JZ751_028007 [Albula glossodonta]